MMQVRTILLPSLTPPLPPGHAYLSFFSVASNILAFSQREHSGVSINVYSTTNNSVQRLWRTRQYVETAAKRGRLEVEEIKLNTTG